MENLSYKEQYLSPKWQKRRLEILQRDGFKCRHCGSDDKTLHVHHHRYIKGRNVWEYDDSELMTLCDSCHEVEHGEKDRLYERFLDLKKSFEENGLSSSLLSDLLWVIRPETLKIEEGELKNTIKSLYFHRIIGFQFDSDIKALERLGMDFKELKNYHIVRT